MKVCIAVGARPQFIKAALVVRAFARLDGVRVFQVHTGQHYDAQMSGVFFSELGIPEPEYNLAVGSGPHGAMTGRMLEGFEEVLAAEHPDAIVVFGDTNSTIAAALAASKLHIPVVHVEAGLRSFNRRMPEEVNRVLTDHASELLLVPTRAAIANLVAEGFSNVANNGQLVEPDVVPTLDRSPRMVANVGDVMFDAALFFSEQAERQSRVLQEHGLTPGRFALATVHRAENTDDLERLEQIFKGLTDCADRMLVVLPLHPRTRAVLDASGWGRALLRRLVVLPPLGYLDMVMLEKSAQIVLTDSGGVQKEAFFHGVPCITLRDETEWTELVEIGANEIVGASRESISKAFDVCMSKSVASGTGVYGRGRASETVASIVVHSLE